MFRPEKRPKDRLKIIVYAIMGEEKHFKLLMLGRSKSPRYFFIFTISG